MLMVSYSFGGKSISLEELTTAFDAMKLEVRAR